MGSGGAAPGGDIVVRSDSAARGWAAERTASGAATPMGSGGAAARGRTTLVVRSDSAARAVTKLVDAVPVRARRWLALATALLVAVTVCWPVLAHPDRDGFPLSTYPMFSSRRSTSEPLSTVVGVDADGDQHWLDPWLLNGTHEVVQAAAVVSDEISTGEAPRLCADVAARVATRSAGGELVRLEVVTVRYDAVDWFAGDRQPLERTVHAACPVPDSADLPSSSGAG